MYETTYEQKQQVHKNRVISQIKVLNYCLNLRLWFLKVIWKVVLYDCTFENSRVESIRLRPAII